MEDFLFVIPALGVGGAEMVTVSLANQMAVNKKFKPELIVCTNINLDLLKNVNCKTTVLSYPSTLRSAYVLFRKIRSYNNPELVVFSTFLNTSVILSVIRCFVKFRLIIREPSNPQLDFDKHHVKTLIYYFLAKKLYKRASIIISNSLEKIKIVDQFYQINNIQKIFYLPNPIQNKEKNYDSCPDITLDREKYINLVCAGRITRSKGFDLIIKAIPKLQFGKQSAKLFIIGPAVDTGYFNELTRLIKEYGIEEKVVFLGFQNNIASCLGKFDLFIMTSYYEGFPNVLFDAIAAKIKIVSTDCNFGPREILQDSAFGTLTEVGSVDSLVKGINRAMGLGKVPDSEFEKIAERFSANNVIHMLETRLQLPDLAD
jgi:glycosyltransferase involved in cell wall biosynthesis